MLKKSAEQWKTKNYKSTGYNDPKINENIKTALWQIGKVRLA